MSIDFQPMQQPAASQPVTQQSSGIDFQPLQQPDQTTPTPTPIPDPNDWNERRKGGFDKIVGGLDAMQAKTVQGAIEGVGQIGTLAKNILSAGSHLIYGKLLGNTAADQNIQQGLNLMSDPNSDPIVSGYNKVKQAVSDAVPDYQKKDIKDNPIAAGLGYVGGQVLAAGGTGVSKLADTTGSVALDAAGPIVAKSPILSGFINQGVQGSMYGMMNDPDNPLRGAASGALLSAPLGAVGGALNERVVRAGKIIEDGTTNAVAMGDSPGSRTTIAQIQSELKSNGMILDKLDIKKSIANKAQDIIDDIKPPTGIPDGEAPNLSIAKAAAQNFPAELQKSKVLYAPINNSEAELPVNNFTNTLKNVQQDIPSEIKLPDPETQLGKTPTLDDMLQYRQKLDGKIAQAKGLAQNNILSHDDVMPLYQLRNAISDDIHTGANSIGLGDQLAAAENHYNTAIRPYTVYKPLGQLKTMDQGEMQNAVWQKLTRLSKARAVNPEDYVSVAQTLGPDGKDLVGWARIQQNFNNAQVNGVLKPSVFSNQVSKDMQSGLGDIIYSPAHKEAIQGLQNLMLRGQNAISAMKPQQGYIQKVYNATIGQLTQSRAGIALLKLAGGSNPYSAGARYVTQKLVTAVSAIATDNASKSRALQLQKQNQQQQQPGTIQNPGQ